MLRAGLTGNIATGKSYAAMVFAELGAHIIDADLIVHELLERGTETYGKVVEAFGRQILDPDGSINRTRLGKIVFGNEDRRLLLNSLIHPEVRKQIFQRIFDLEKQYPAGIIIVEAALMIESGAYKMYDRLIVVACDVSLQIARLISRSHLTEEDARARIAAQMPIEEKLRFADYTIDTSATFRQTQEQTEAIYRDLLLQERCIREHRG